MPFDLGLSVASLPDEDQTDSGYSSANVASSPLPPCHFSRSQLEHINKQLSTLEPMDILTWCIVTFPRLFQTTAFGLTGLAINEMLSTFEKPKPDIDMIFFDTLYHFGETLDLVEKVKERYPRLKIHVFKPQGCNNAQEFEAKYGERLWETDEERYDYVAKVEPAQRAYKQLNVPAVITGRRRTQGGKRGDIDIIEVDDNDMVKINPMANWTYSQVEDYVMSRHVPTNSLLSKGYRSVGDWHSTMPVTEGEDERAGRWKGRAKSECGIHNKKSRYAMFLQEQEKKRQLNRAVDSALDLAEGQEC